MTYKFPQIWKLYRTRDTSGISVFSQIVQASAYAFYIIHGTLIKDPPVVLLGVASLLQSVVLIFQYFLYKNNNSKEKNINNGNSHVNSNVISNKIATIDSESPAEKNQHDNNTNTNTNNNTNTTTIIH